ncbi:hypothetical protein [Streptomyces cinereoruber]|uniref:hypothetical protein n=1 Tax=Streptomyces cinereoruber TaxID=67260 RepID=UPI003630E82A
MTNQIEEQAELDKLFSQVKNDNPKSRGIIEWAEKRLRPGLEQLLATQKKEWEREMLNVIGEDEKETPDYHPDPEGEGGAVLTEVGLKNYIKSVGFDFITPSARNRLRQEQRDRLAHLSSKEKGSE